MNSSSSNKVESSDNLAQHPAAVNQNTVPSRRGMVRAAGMLGGMTFLSRVLGMTRDIVSARAFGIGWHWDAFVYAFMIPNFFRRIVGEGALGSAFVPVYHEILHRRGAAEAFRFANILITTLLVGFAVFLLLLEVGLGLLIRYAIIPATPLLTLDLLRFFFPYLSLISLYALGMGILNSHQHFFAPSLSPVILNLCWIFGVIGISSWGAHLEIQTQMRLLSLVILISGVMQFGVEWPFLFRIGFRPRLLWDLGYPPLKKLFGLLLPIIFGFAVVQINLLVDMTLAIWLGPGAGSSLWYGNRLMMFPLGVFAAAMGSVLLPAISHHASRGETREASKSISFALRSVFLIVLPCSMGFLILNSPIVRLLFERGEFDAASTARSAAVLMGYAPGLFAFSGEKILVAGFYAMQDTKTPVKIAVVALVSNIILNLILMHPLREAGLALATSLSGVLQFSLLAVFFKRRYAWFSAGDIVTGFVRIFAATFAAGGVTFFLYPFLLTVFPGEGTWSQAASVFGSMTGAVLSYGFFCFLFRVREMGDLLRQVAARKKVRV